MVPEEIDVDDLRYWMQTQGFVVVPGLLADAGLLRELREGIDRGLEEDRHTPQGARFPATLHLLLNRGPAFVRLLEEGLVDPYMDALLGETCVLHSYNGLRLDPEGTTNASAIHRDSPRFCPGYLLAAQVLFFLDDFSADNGATLLLPGSQHVAQRPSDEQFHERCVQVTGPAGTALIFDSALWHSGGVNRTNHPRRGVTLVYTRAFMKQQIDLVRALDPELEASVSPRVRQRLGFDVRVPASLDEFYRPEAERLYKANQG